MDKTGNSVFAGSDVLLDETSGSRTLVITSANVGGFEGASLFGQMNVTFDVGATQSLNLGRIELDGKLHIKSGNIIHVQGSILAKDVWVGVNDSIYSDIVPLKFKGKTYGYEVKLDANEHSQLSCRNILCDGELAASGLLHADGFIFVKDGLRVKSGVIEGQDIFTYYAHRNGTIEAKDELFELEPLRWSLQRAHRWGKPDPIKDVIGGRRQDLFKYYLFRFHPRNEFAPTSGEALRFTKMNHALLKRA